MSRINDLVLETGNVTELRAEIERLCEVNRWHGAETDRLRTENAMLRADNAALRGALAGYQSWHRLEQVAENQK